MMRKTNWREKNLRHMKDAVVANLAYWFRYTRWVFFWLPAAFAAYLCGHTNREFYDWIVDRMGE